MGYLSIIFHENDPVVSASQISTFRDCPRKWAFDKIEKRPRKDSPEAERGRRVHSFLEHWSLGGSLPQGDSVEVRLTRKLALYAPPPRTSHVEGYFRCAFLGIRYQGIKDLFYVEEGLPVVHDWKTTSDLKWALTEEKLRTDPQGLLYALDTFTKGGANELALRWVYGTAAKRPRVRVVETRMRRDETAAAFLKHVHTPASQIVLTKRNVREAHDLRGNPQACHKYGGCPYRDICKLTKKERLDSLMDQETLRQRLEAQQSNGQAAPVASAPPVAVPPHLIRQTPDGMLIVATASGNYAHVYQGQDGAYYTAPGVVPQEPQQAAQPAPALQQPAQPAPALQQPAQPAPAPQQAAQPAQPAPAPQQAAQPAPAPQQAFPVPEQPTHAPTDINQPVSQAPDTAGDESKTRKPRKATTAKSRTLSLDQQVWLAGAQRQTGPGGPEELLRAGNAMLAAFHQRFGE